MKKLLLTLAAAMTCASMAFADASIVINEQNDVTAGDPAATRNLYESTKEKGGKFSWTSGDFTFTVTTPPAAADAKYANTAAAYNKAGDLRVYANSTFTIKAKEAMTKVVFNISAQGKKRLAPITASAGTIAEQAKGDATVTWTGSATEVTFTVGAKANFGSDGETKAGQLDFNSFDITGGGKAGASEPVTPPVVTVEEVNDIAGFIAKCTKSSYPTVKIKGDVRVVAQYNLPGKNNSTNYNLYIQDASGSLLVYGDTKFEYKNGDVIAGGFQGAAQDYNGTYELSSPEGFTAGTAGAAVEPKEMSMDEISAANVNEYLILKGVSIIEKEGKQYVSGDAEFEIYNKFKLESIPTGEGLNVTFIVSVYNGNVQVYPMEITTASGKEKVAAPTFSVAAGAVNEGTEVTLACATEGATIKYTVDGTENWLDYAGTAIVINQATTIKAYATAEGMDDSEVVTAEYTIKAPVEVVGNEATFNFNEPSTLDPAQDLGEETSLDVPATGFTANGVTLTYVNGTAATRLYKDYNSVVIQLRVYQTGSFTIAAPAGYELVTIEMTGNKLKSIELNNAADASAEAYTYTAAAKETSKTFNVIKFDNDNKRADLSTIKVTIKKAESGIEAIGTEQAPVEYYNLQGVRVSGNEPGLYIRRQGSKATKVLVK